jgi:tRNA dimethylallyltransferase
MHLAAKHGARIISADSRQIYRDFDIGTAKPSRADQLAVPHAGLDVADPAERWNAAKWAAAARGRLAEDAGLGRASIVVGGTGLWLQALVRPLADEPALDPAKRAALQEELGALDSEELRRWVERLDPTRAHLGRAQLLRAAEVALLSGTPLSEWHARGSSHPQLEARWLVVDPGAVLDDRLNQRRAEMLASGWLDEVRSLDLRYPGDLPAWNACGYREIREVVQGTRALDAAMEAVRISTRQYAKRQRTWFRNQMDGVGPVLRLDPTAADALATAEHWFNEGES